MKEMTLTTDPTSNSKIFKIGIEMIHVWHAGLRLVYRVLFQVFVKVVIEFMFI
jgi:hypothetical protein